MLVEHILHKLLRGVLGGCRAREKGRISDPPTVSRTALSATSFTVISGFWRLNSYFAGSWMRQRTTKLTWMIFQSPVSIVLSVRTLLAPPPSARISKECEHHCNARSHDGEPILQFFKALPPSLD